MQNQLAEMAKEHEIERDNLVEIHVKEKDELASAADNAASTIASNLRDEINDLKNQLKVTTEQHESEKEDNNIAHVKEIDELKQRLEEWKQKSESLNQQIIKQHYFQMLSLSQRLMLSRAIQLDK